MFKRALKTIGILFLAALLLGFLPATLGGYGPYWKRYSTAFLTNPLSPAYWWYEPLERVPGGGVRPIPPAEGDIFDAQVRDAAIEYAGAHSTHALLVLYRGELALEHYWEGAASDTLIAAHSMTKTLPALMLGHAIADGFITSPDEPAAKYLPEWDTEERRGITIRDLANMASGVQESYDFSPRSLRMQRTMGVDIVPANLQVEVKHPPGTVFAHFNPNSQLLGVIIQRASGRRFSQYLSEKLWRPLGAHDGFLFVDQPGGMVHTDCCMWAAVSDWARLGEMLRRGGTVGGVSVLPEGWVAAVTEPSKANSNYGMQIWLGNRHEENRRYDPSLDTFANLHSEPFVARDIFYLDGLGKQRVYIIPSRELVIVRVGKGSSDYDDARLPNLFTRAVDGLSQAEPS